MNAPHTAGILGGQGGDDAHAVAAQQSNGFQVGLYAGATATVRAGYRQHSAIRHRLTSVELQSDFTGCQGRRGVGHDRRDQGDGIGAGSDDLAGVVPVDAADSYQGHVDRFANGP